MDRKRIFAIGCISTATVLFAVWPLSHWFWYDFYAAFLGAAPGTYQESLIRMIGTCGLLPCFCLVVIGLCPSTTKLLTAALSLFLVLLALTFVYLVRTSDFTRAEYLNALAFTALAIALPVFQRWANRR